MFVNMVKPTGDFPPFFRTLWDPRKQANFAAEFNKKRLRSHIVKHSKSVLQWTIQETQQAEFRPLT